MIILEKTSNYMKAVLAIVIGEQVMRMLPKGDGFLHSRKTLDLCWKCIEEWENVTGDVIDDLCNCICAPDDIDFDYYFSTSGDATIANIYLLLDGISGYIDAQMMKEIGEPRPEYLDVSETDEGFTETLDYAKKVNENYFEEFKLQKVLTYCNEKQNEKGTIRFCREEILSLL